MKKRTLTDNEKFKLRLCLALGKTYEEVKAMSAEETQMWLAYDLEHPIGHLGVDYHFAHLIQGIYSAHGVNVEFDKCFMRFGEKKPQSIDAMKAIVAAWAGVKIPEKE